MNTDNYLDLAEEKISFYNNQEREARKNTAIELLKYFSPIVFNEGNNQTNVSSSKELWKFFDSMQEFRTGYYFDEELMGSITKPEYEMIKKLAIKNGELYKIFKKNTNPTGLNHIISSISTLRVIENLSEIKSKKLSILEIGGGSGMLGHICYHKGHTYTNFDITQGYIINNIVSNLIFYKEEFGDFSKYQIDPDPNWFIDKQRKINFIPWWNFINNNLKLPEFDLIVMNHCFCEISTFSLDYIFRRLSPNDGTRQKLFVSGWGDSFYNKEMTQVFLSKLERRYKFKQEPIASNTRLFKGELTKTLLLSFKDERVINKNEKDFSKFYLAGQKKQNQSLLERYIKLFIPLKIKRLIKERFIPILYMRFNKPKILGPFSDKKQIFHIKDQVNNENQNLLNAEDFNILIKELENKFGKPICTENEMLYNFLGDDSPFYN